MCSSSQCTLCYISNNRLYMKVNPIVAMHITTDSQVFVIFEILLELVKCCTISGRNFHKFSRLHLSFLNFTIPLCCISICHKEATWTIVVPCHPFQATCFQTRILEIGIKRTYGSCRKYY